MEVFFGTLDRGPIVPSGDKDRPFGWFSRSLGQVSALTELGAVLLVYLDEHRRLLGWYLAQSQIGVDIRDWKGDT
jgi:hypothetical protein